jgi:hypothetical protein
VKDIRRLLWLLADYSCRALIHVIDHLAAKPKPRED